MSDKGKIFLLWIAIIFIIFVILGVGYLTYLNIREENKTGSSSNTTSTRRTISKTRTTKEFSTTEITTTTEEVTTTTNNVVTTTRRNSSNNGSSSGGSSSNNNNNNSNGNNNSSGGSVVVTTPTVSFETTTSATRYPNAVDALEWDLVNQINQTRRRNGLNDVQVATRLRQLAEEAADRVTYNSDATLSTSNFEPANNYLNGEYWNSVMAWLQKAPFSNTTKYQNNYTFLEGTMERAGHQILFTSSDIKYIGVGVIEKEVTIGSRGTYNMYIIMLIYT